MISILTWVAIISGGILILLLLLSIFGGMDLDVDVDIGSADVETDAGGLGIVKGLLTMVSVAAWVIKVLLVSNQNPGVAITIGILSGLLALVLLQYLLKALLRNEENVNWSINDALYQSGKVYLKIPSGGSGIVQIDVKGAIRELKAKSNSKKAIETGAAVQVIDLEGDMVIVDKTA